MFLFSAVDTQAKFLTTDFHPAQVIWFRQLGLFIGVIILLAMKGPSILSTAQPALQLIRGVLAICSGLLFVYAIRHAELVDAVAVSFVAPFFLTILGAFFLGEKVGIRRWSAVAVGFIGAIIIIRPGTDAVHPAVLLVSTLLISLPMPLVWNNPVSTSQVLLIILMATMAAAGEILVIKSLEVAEAVVVAPIHYTLIIWGTIYGYLVFGQLPDRWTWVGTAIIVMAGLFTLRRSHSKTKTLE